jgi:hypothetical protein
MNALRRLWAARLSAEIEATVQQRGWRIIRRHRQKAASLRHSLSQRPIRDGNSVQFSAASYSRITVR